MDIVSLRTRLIHIFVDWCNGKMTRKEMIESVDTLLYKFFDEVKNAG